MTLFVGRNRYNHVASLPLRLLCRARAKQESNARSTILYELVLGRRPGTVGCCTPRHSSTWTPVDNIADVLRRQTTAALSENIHDGARRGLARYLLWTTNLGKQEKAALRV